MIARQSRGWTEPQNADTYEALLKDKVLLGRRNIQGYCGGYVLRSDGPVESDFVVINLFDSLESVKAFAGSDYRTLVFEPKHGTIIEDRTKRDEPKGNELHWLRRRKKE